MNTLTTRRSHLQQQVRTALENLGPDVISVALSLHAGNFTGIPRNPRGCPVHSYLQSVLPIDQVERLSTGSGTITVVLPYPSDEAAGKQDLEVHVDPPRPVASFIRRFDSGDYPDLAIDYELTEEDVEYLIQSYASCPQELQAADVPRILKIARSIGGKHRALRTSLLSTPNLPAQTRAALEAWNPDREDLLDEFGEDLLDGVA